MSAIERFPTLRQSLLNDFDACALAAKFAMDYSNLKQEPPHNVLEWSSHPAGRGQLCHRVLAKCMNEMAAQGEGRIETDVAHAILSEVLRQADVPPEEVVPVPMREVADLYWIVTKFAHDNTWSIERLVSVEERLWATLRYPDPEGGFIERTLTGQLDALFSDGGEGAIVLDHKTTWGMPGPTDISFEGYFQQRMYAWLVMRTYPAIQKVTLREWYVRFSEPREATVYRDQLEEVESELAALVERFDRAYDTDTWKPAPGKHCSYCPRPTACPIFPSARQEGRIADADGAAQVAAQVVVAEAALKQSKAALRAWADVHGPVPIKAAKEAGRVYGFQVSTTVLRPEKDKLEEALSAAGRPLSQKEIDALYTTRIGTKFVQHVPQPVVEPDDDIMEKLRRSVEEAEARR